MIAYSCLHGIKLFLFLATAAVGIAVDVASGSMLFAYRFCTVEFVQPENLNVWSHLSVTPEKLPGQRTEQKKKYMRKVKEQVSLQFDAITKFYEWNRIHSETNAFRMATD